MKCESYAVRSGYDKKKCIVHARCCYTPEIMVATAQYLNVEGSDVFDGIMFSTSVDEGKTWSEFKASEGLGSVFDGDYRIVGSDATPMYHKKTGKILLLGHTAEYEKNALSPINRKRYTFYSVYNKEKNEFSKMKFIEMPAGFEQCGNGSGQSVELENGELLIPVYYKKQGKTAMYSAVIRCSFDGREIKMLEMGNSLTIDIERGLYEPSVVFHEGMYYMTMRNDECACVAKSVDGLHYTDLQHWKWDDGSLVDSYNTQQHWMKVNGKLCLVYTRRGAGNDHVFRHRAPLFAAEVKDMKLVRDSEIAVVCERGARLGNFCATEYKDGKAIIMAAEWMQPKGCEKYGSDNSVFISVIED